MTNKQDVRVGVCLSGCGVFDGSEIHEAVLTLLALDEEGATAICIAPDTELDVVNHRTGEETGERRSVLDESARIARGNIRDLAEVTAEDLDALVFPGGYGAAKNLSDFAASGPRARPNAEVARLVVEMLEARKPIGGICISPAMLAAVLRDHGMKGRLTIGRDAQTAGHIESMGSKHLECPVQEFRVDEAHRIVTTPAYMLEAGVAGVAQGIRKLVGEVVRMAREGAPARV